MDINQLKELYCGKTIHIVGNAAIHQPLGEEIDSSKVLRFNLGYTSSFLSPLNYGRKTNILSIASSRRRRIAKDDLEFLIDMETIIWIDSIWPELAPFIPDYIKDDPRTYFYKREDWEFLFSALKNNKPSSGIMVFDLFHRQIGSRVKLYGFDWWKGPTVHHRPREHIHNPHNGKMEREYILMRLGSNNSNDDNDVSSNSG